MSSTGGNEFDVDTPADSIDVGAVLTDSSAVDTVEEADMYRQRGDMNYATELTGKGLLAENFFAFAVRRFSVFVFVLVSANIKKHAVSTLLKIPHVSVFSAAIP